MNVDFRKSFAKDLRKIRIKNIGKKVKDKIEEVENALNLMEPKLNDFHIQEHICLYG